MVIECNGCQYCQTIFEHTKDGRFQMLGNDRKMPEIF